MIRRANVLRSAMAAVLLAVGLVTAGGLTQPASAAGVGKGGFTAVPQVRVLDTRSAGGGGCLGDATRTVDVEAVAPAVAGAAAVAVNVTAVDATEPGWITVWPGGARPATSTVNFPVGTAVPNFTVTGLAPDGTVRVAGSRGCVHVIVDLVGYYRAAEPVPDTYGFKPVAPARLVDTRSATDPMDPSKANPHAGCLGGSRQTLSLSPLGTAGLPLDPGRTILPDPTRVLPDALVVNIAVVAPDSNGWITAHGPSRGLVPAPAPDGSSLDYVRGEIRTSTVVLVGGHPAPISLNPDPAAPWTVTLSTHGGCPHVVIDLVGWTRVSSRPGASPQPVTTGGMIAMQPSRVLDTRTRPPQHPSGCIDGRATIGVVRGDLMPTNGEVAAVALKIAAVGARSSGWLTVWDGSQPVPPSSSVNYVAGPGAVSNLVLAKVDPNGNIALRSSSGCPQVVVDVVGWFSAITRPDT